LDKVSASDVLVSVKLNPCTSFIPEPFSKIRLLDKYIFSKCLRGERLLGLIVVYEVHDPHATNKDSVHFPALLNRIADAPCRVDLLGSHKT
jgi:hypothetical protein